MTSRKGFGMEHFCAPFQTASARFWTEGIIWPDERIFVLPIGGGVGGGQVHADGEIIAPATFSLAMDDRFREAFASALLAVHSAMRPVGGQAVVGTVVQRCVLGHG